MLNIMCPGPTRMRENVRFEMAKEVLNPDIDRSFSDSYHEICAKFQDYFHTKNQVIMMGAEALLSLEAAVASLTEEGTRVLVIDNGIYGEGFKGFVEMYGGEPLVFTSDYYGTFDMEGLKALLEKDSNFLYATLVACDTPSGIRNDIEEICQVLNGYGIMSVVDAVSECFVSDIDVDKAGADIFICGSQKALSAPTGVGIVAVSDRAYEAISNRKTPVKAFYANLDIYKDYRTKGFPYTMPITLINAVGVALDNAIADKERFSRHERIASATREALKKAGLKLLLNSAYSNGVTAIKLEGIDPFEFVERLRKEYGVQIATSYGVFARDVIRIGHMGENCNFQGVYDCLGAIQELLKSYSVELGLSLKEEFKALYR